MKIKIVNNINSLFKILNIFIFCTSVYADRKINKIQFDNNQGRKTKDVIITLAKDGYQLKIINYIYYDQRKGVIAPKGVGEYVFEINLIHADVHKYIGFLESEKPKGFLQIDILADNAVRSPIGKITCHKDTDGNVVMEQKYESVMHKTSFTGMLSSLESIELSKRLTKIVNGGVSGVRCGDKFKRFLHVFLGIQDRRIFGA